MNQETALRFLLRFQHDSNTAIYCYTVVTVSVSSMIYWSVCLNFQLWMPKLWNLWPQPLVTQISIFDKPNIHGHNVNKNTLICRGSHCPVLCDFSTYCTFSSCFQNAHLLFLLTPLTDSKSPRSPQVKYLWCLTSAHLLYKAAKIFERA